MFRQLRSELSQAQPHFRQGQTRPQRDDPIRAGVQYSSLDVYYMAHYWARLKSKACFVHGPTSCAIGQQNLVHA